MTDLKHQNLINILKGYDSLAIAFSGGVDSSLLLHLASKVLKEKVIAVTIVSDLLPGSELDASMEFTKNNSIEHKLIEIDILSNTFFTQNPPDRCYICKKHILEKIIETANKYEIQTIAHGANIDDLGDYRPGMKAAVEYGIKAPFIEAEFTKDNIRELSQKEGLKTFNKQEMACLASRIPTGSLITKEKLKRIELSEELLKKEGFIKYRVRHIENEARIELSEDEIAKFLDSNLRLKIVKNLREYGFHNITLDLDGYKKGAMNISGK